MMLLLEIKAIKYEYLEMEIIFGSGHKLYFVKFDLANAFN